MATKTQTLNTEKPAPESKDNELVLTTEAYLPSEPFIQPNDSAPCKASHEAFDYLVLTKPGESDQEGLFPTGEVSGIVGPSGAGKTTWLLKFINTWRTGTSFFGRPACPKQFMYLSFDRSRNGLLRTLKRMKFDLKQIPHWRPRTAGEQRMSLVQIMTAIREYHLQRSIDIKVFFIEGLDMKVPDDKISDPHVVKEYLSELQRFAEENHVTIIGTVGSPKQKQGQKYDSPREQIIGTTFWGRMMETIIYLEPDQDMRRLQILSRNGKDEMYTFKWDKGQLVEITQLPNNKPQQNDDRIVSWLDANVKQNQEFSIGNITAGLQLKSTSVQWVVSDEKNQNNLIKRGLVERAKHGLYRWKGTKDGSAGQQLAPTASTAAP